MKKTINLFSNKTLVNISIAIASVGLLISCGLDSSSRSHPYGSRERTLRPHLPLGRQSLFRRSAFGSEDSVPTSAVALSGERACPHLTPPTRCFAKRDLGNQQDEVFAALGACIRVTEDRAGSQVSEIKEGIDINQDPFGAIQKLLEIGKGSGVFNNDLPEENNINPISFRELIEYLPQTPRGWTAEKPKGQTSSFGDYGVSQVKQRYFQNDKTMTVSIFDWAFNSTLYIPFLLSTEFSQESTEGYNKGIQIDDIPGRENYDYYSKNGSLNLLINRRFFVQIDGDNIEESELREWWDILDHRSLAKLK